MKAFHAPDTRDIEALPDQAVFTLRAVLQLEQATADEIAVATLLGAGPISDTLRYSTARGYLEKTGERYRVTWAWFRAITRFLRRRHLLSRRAE